MKKFFVAFIVLFLTLSSSLAQTSQEPQKNDEVVSMSEDAPKSASAEVKDNHLNLSQAIELALEKNVELNEKRKDLEIAKNNIKIANRLQNPTFEMAYGIGKTSDGNPQQLGFSQLLEIGKRSKRKKMAQADLALSDEAIKLAEFNVRMDVREAYVELAAAKAVLKNIEEQQELLTRLVDISQKRVNAGAAAEMEVMQARIVLNQLNIQKNSAKTTVLAAKYNFNKALNVNRSQEDNTFYDIVDETLCENTSFISVLTPPPSRVMPKFDDIKEIAYQKRYDLKISQKEIEVAKKNLEVVMRQRVPDLEVAGGYAYLSPSQNEGSSAMVSGAYAGANLVNIPLMYNYSPEIKNAKLQLEQAHLRYESKRNTALNDLMGAYERFLVAQKNLNYYNESLTVDSKEIVRMAAKSYEVGKSDLTSLIVVEQSYRSIMSGYIEALRDYYICWVDFLRESNDEGFVLDEKSNL